MEKGPKFEVLDDGWTAIASDGGWSAQFEHTVLVTETGVDVLTEDPEDPVRF
jgi:methionyl aminopeptidase